MNLKSINDTQSRTKEAIGFRIHFFRVLFGLKQEDLGVYLDLGPNNFGMIERGRFLPRQNYVARLADLFGVREEWLTTGEGAIVADTTLVIDIPPTSWATAEKSTLRRKNNELSSTLGSDLAKVIDPSAPCTIDVAPRISTFGFPTEGKYLVLRCHKKEIDWPALLQGILKKERVETVMGLPVGLEIRESRTGTIAEGIRRQEILKIAQEIKAKKIRRSELDEALRQIDFND